jgi:hypothetical protein
MVSKKDGEVANPELRVRGIISDAIMAGRYQIAVSIVRKDGVTIDHYLETQSFPLEDRLNSFRKIRDMIIDELVKEE